MTAFLLLEGLITAERVEETYTGTYLMFDMEAIDSTEKYERIKENRALFTTLFGDKPYRRERSLKTYIRKPGRSLG